MSRYAPGYTPTNLNAYGLQVPPPQINKGSGTMLPRLEGAGNYSSADTASNLGQLRAAFFGPRQRPRMGFGNMSPDMLAKFMELFRNKTFSRDRILNRFSNPGMRQQFGQQVMGRQGMTPSTAGVGPALQNFVSQNPAPPQTNDPTLNALQQWMQQFGTGGG